MVHKIVKKGSGNATRASVVKEMAKPRMSKSARIAQSDFDAARIAKQPGGSMPRAMNKIILPLRPNHSEKA